MKKHFLIALACFVLCSCGENKYQIKVFENSKNYFECGYASEIIEIPKNEKLYIAGYHQGAELEGFLDYQKACAMYVNDAIFISIDSVGIANSITEEIRNGLKNISSNVHVFSTHDHAGIDTLGLWGGIAIDGKNKVFMNNLISAAIKAGEKAYNNKQKGKVFYGYKDTEDLQYDSRNPICFDSNVYQFRFVGEKGNGIRLINYAAHAESLRGSNYQISADYVGELRDIIKSETGDDILFIQGAIGGLIMTKELVDPFEAVENMKITGKVLADYINNIDNEKELKPKLKIKTKNFETNLDNTLYMYYKFLGILENKMTTGNSMTGYKIISEASIITLDSILIYMIPGEIFPELVYGNFLGKNDPDTLENLAKKSNYNNPLIFGLANDELGYIIPKSQYLLNDKAPYINTIKDETGENHYEETNSTSINCCVDLYNCYSQLLAHKQ